jgi:hypothetical protein
VWRNGQAFAASAQLGFEHPLTKGRQLYIVQTGERPEFRALLGGIAIAIAEAMLRRGPVACLLAVVLISTTTIAGATGTVVEPLPASAGQPVAAGVQTLAPPPAPQPHPVPESEWPKIHQLRPVVLGTGIAVFSIIYGLTLLDSLLTYDGFIDGDPCSYCKKQALLFLIPVAGPWLGESVQPTGPGYGNHLYTLDAIWSGIEAVSLAMIIIGAVGHDVPVKPFDKPATKVSLVPLLTPDGGALSLRLRW